MRFVPQVVNAGDFELGLAPYFTIQAICAAFKRPAEEPARAEGRR